MWDPWFGEQSHKGEKSFEILFNTSSWVPFDLLIEVFNSSSSRSNYQSNKKYFLLRERSVG